MTANLIPSLMGSGRTAVAAGPAGDLVAGLAGRAG